MKLDNYKCEGQMSIFDYLKAADPEPEKEPEKEIEVGKWTGEHGPRVMFDDIKEGHYYIADYSTESHKWYKIIFVKWKDGDDVGYTDAPKGVKGQWKWGNNYSSLTRKRYINADKGQYPCCGMSDTNGWWYDLPDAAADPEARLLKTEESKTAADPEPKEEPRQLKNEQSEKAAGQTVDRYGRLREAPDWMDPKRCETCKYWSRYPVEEQPPAGWGVYGQCDCYHEPEMMKNGYWKVSKTSCCCDYKSIDGG